MSKYINGVIEELDKLFPQISTPYSTHLFKCDYLKNTKGKKAIKTFIRTKLEEQESRFKKQQIINNAVLADKCDEMETLLKVQSDSFLRSPELMNQASIKCALMRQEREHKILIKTMLDTKNRELKEQYELVRLEEERVSLTEGIMSDELYPCPLCKEEKQLQVVEVDRKNPDRNIIKCRKCRCEGLKGYWQNRKPDKELIKALEVFIDTVHMYSLEEKQGCYILIDDCEIKQATRLAIQALNKYKGV